MTSNEAIGDVIASAVEETGRYPFLFIGSGLSKRYMGTPSWDELLRMVCADVLSDDFAYARYLSAARQAVELGKAGAILPYVATLMERDVNDVLLSSPRFEDFRTGNSEWLMDGGSPMRLFISQTFRRFRVGPSSEADLLREAGLAKVSGVITTNYDGLCSELFSGFDSYVGEDGLLFREPTYAQEIYQIHGSMDLPESLVLTDSDYRRFSDRQKYLAAKLLTIFVEYPVIFMGYSIQDPNIQSILSSISRCVGPKRIGTLQKRLIFVTWEQDVTPSVGPQLMTFDGQSILMTNVTLDDFSPIYEAMRASQKLYDVRALRELRGSVFSIVPKLDAKSQTIVASMDKAIDTLGEGDKVVIGFGRETSDYGKSVKLSDLYRDVVLDDLMLPDALVVDQYLDDLLKHNSGSVPVYKYLERVGIEFDSCDEVGEYLGNYVRKYTSVESFLSDTQLNSRRAYRDRSHGRLSVSTLIEREGEDRAFQFVKYLNENEVDIDDLREYLSSLLHDADGNINLRMLETDTYKSEFRKCVRIYDFMRYRYGI